MWHMDCSRLQAVESALFEGSPGDFTYGFPKAAVRNYPLLYFLLMRKDIPVPNKIKLLALNVTTPKTVRE